MVRESRSEKVEDVADVTAILPPLLLKLDMFVLLSEVRVLVFLDLNENTKYDCVRYRIKYNRVDGRVDDTVS